MMSRTARRLGLASLLAISALQTACLPPPWWFWRDDRREDRRDDRGYDRGDRDRQHDHDDRRDHDDRHDRRD